MDLIVADPFQAANGDFWDTYVYTGTITIPAQTLVE
jgi:hypothetical protein